MKKNKDLLAAVLAAVLAAGCAFSMPWHYRADGTGKENSVLRESTLGYSRANGAAVVLNAENASIMQTAKVESDYAGYDGDVIISNDNSVIEWRFEASAGDYMLEAEYYPVQTDSSSSVYRTLTLNNDENSNFSVYFVRRWVDDLGESGEFIVDSYGNQIRPSQIQEPDWLTTPLYDGNSNSNIPIVFSLKDGENILKLSAVDDQVAIKSLKFFPCENLKSYDKIKEEYEVRGFVPAKNQNITIEAEKSLYKSDCTIYPNYERSSVAVSPSSATKQRVNVIGGDGWSTQGQYVVWETDIEQSGLYCISFKYLKNSNQGLSSYRRLYIDGKVPFAEANGIEFPYNSKYEALTLGSDDEPYYFYFSKGRHEIKLEVCLGDMTDILDDFGDSIYNLNSIYRRIIVVTGTAPDFYRDYEFEKIIPDVIEDIAKEIEELQDIYDRWYALVKEKGSTFSTLDLILNTLRSMEEDPENIARKLSSFKTYIGSCGTLLNNARAGKLQLDAIEIYSPDMPEPEMQNGFFRQLWFSVKATLVSYVTDYNAIGTINSDKKLDEVRVWVSGGREQYELLKNMTNDGSLEKLGIRANLQLTSASLLQTVVAGIAPDIMLNCDGSTVIEYALRGALQELDGFEGFDEIYDDYYEECFVPLKLEEHIYALPTTMAFNVLFYRTDILEDMNLDIPETWDDVTRLITILNKSNMEFGLPQTMETYYAMLVQRGGKIYNENGSRVLLDSQSGIDIFTKYTRYFTDYGQPVSYDAQNRFRTGEMPMVIADYTFFNTLSVAAPEITGLWDFTLMPGTIQEDGSVLRTSCITVNGSIMTKQCQNKEAAWKFLKWWTSADVQTNYGRALESILGASSRYGAANINAMSNMPWTSHQKQILMEQLNCSTALPQVPGDYILTREFSNAFKLVVNEGENPKDSLLEKVKIINSELTAKRKEFGLETAE